MTLEDLKETAEMAYLDLDEGELAGILPDFEQMLRFFAPLQASDEALKAFPDSTLTGAYGNSRIVNSDFYRSGNSNPANVFRNPSSGLNDNLLNNAGERDGRFFVIPNVL